jgi:arsenate reductase-like glutaredoxin family protein
MQAATAKAARDYLQENNINPKEYTYKKKLRKE